MAAATKRGSRAAAKSPPATIEEQNESGGMTIEGSSPVHLAAVVGDKALLAKLIVGDPHGIDSSDQFGRTPLMFCVLADRQDCLELLLKAGATINKKDRGGRTALHWAAHKGNFKAMKTLLGKGAAWKDKDAEGQTSLHLCTRHKAAKCLMMLLKHVGPGEVDDQDKNKRTALHWSASYGNLEHVRLLIKHDSNIGIPDIEGKTPLHWAASSNDPQAVACVNIILEVAPSVVNWQDYEGRTALHLAVADGNESVVDALTSLEKCNVSALDNMFRTPLHWAAVLGHTKIVALLLDKNADFASSDSNGATSLHYAAQNNFADTVEVFLRRKHIKDEPDIEGRTAFMWAAGKGADDVIKIWQRYGCDVNETDKNGGTALHAAALAGHPSTVKLLLENKSPIDAIDLLRHTPLFRACEMGHTDVVQTLIDNGARVDMLDQHGRSPLHWAALGGHAYICQILIKYGIGPNTQDGSGRTPLHCTAYGGFVNCMSILMDHKADPNAQDHEGMTALHWACSKGHLDAIKLLLEYGAFPNHMEFTEERYTPLDYALMGEFQEVSQFLMEQGALSITGIQEIAASKIQSYFRGYRVRKSFFERKRLLMKHEQLRRKSQVKKTEDVYKKKIDPRNKQEVKVRITGQTEEKETEAQAAPTPSARLQKQQQRAQDPNRGLRREPPSEDQKILAKHKEHKAVVDAERERQLQFKQRWRSAVVIQRWWHQARSLKLGMLQTAAEAIKIKRLAAGEEEWNRQIAALTIQLAWRKYYRRKVTKLLSKGNKKLMYMWDPSVIGAKQAALLSGIYGPQRSGDQWSPRYEMPSRPGYLKNVPSPAAVSYNFAVDHYDPEVARTEMRRSQYFLQQERESRGESRDHGKESRSTTSRDTSSREQSMRSGRTSSRGGGVESEK